MSALLDKVRSRGYWRFVIRPQTFREDRISDFALLYDLIQKNSVKLGGWEVPALNPRIEAAHGQDWVGQELDWSQYVELWRLYQSGQFVHYSGILSDWLDQAAWAKVSEDWKAGTALHVPEVLFRLTGFFELAARLALSDAGDDAMHVEITASKLQRRALTEDVGTFSGFSRVRTTRMAEFPRRFDLARDALISRPRELALEVALELFKRFDWNPSLELLQKHQEHACRF